MSQPAIDHSYRYPHPSRIDPATTSAGSHLVLATSGGAAPNPYFFEGVLTRPRVTAQLLRTLSDVVGARYHLPPAMLERILALADPVVTSGRGMVRFEGFSGCCSAYARVDLAPESYDSTHVAHGTTNVDFNAPMRAALAQVRDSDRVGLSVGQDEVRLARQRATDDTPQEVVERKVTLPLRWLKGFVEVQAYQSRMTERLRIPGREAVRFLRGLPRTGSGRFSGWLTRVGRSLRMSQRPVKGGIRLAGVERLRVLEPIVTLADELRVYADDQDQASAWALRCGDLCFTLVLSAEVWRGFSGEGQALDDLLSVPDALPEVRAQLKWQAELAPADLATVLGRSSDEITASLRTLGSRGLVGYDVGRGAFFHRELPFDLELVASLQPRLRNARKLVEAGGITVEKTGKDTVTAKVPGSGVVHSVKLTPVGARCSCPWFSKHQGQRGPCKHVLAAQLVLQKE